MWDKRAQLVRVKDGDTIVTVLDQGFRTTLEIDVRLYGVYAPELRDVGGEQTRQFVVDWFASLPVSTWPFIVTTHRMKTVDREQTTLERYVATVTSLDGSRNLNIDVQAFVQASGYGGGA